MRLVHKLKKYKKEKKRTVSLLFSEGSPWCDVLMYCAETPHCVLFPSQKQESWQVAPRLVVFVTDGKKAATALHSRLNCGIAADPKALPLSKGRRTWHNVLWLQVLKGFHWKGSPSKKRKTAVAVGFFNDKMLRNRWNRCDSLSEALTVLRCWGLLQIFKFQGVPKSFQVGVTRDSPERHVVLEWNQKRVFFGFRLILRSKQLS